MKKFLLLFTFTSFLGSRANLDASSVLAEFSRSQMQTTINKNHSIFIANEKTFFESSVGIYIEEWRKAKKKKKKK